MELIPPSSILILLESCLQTCMTYTIAEYTVNKFLMMDRGFVKLVHLVGFIVKKFVTMHGNMNVKFEVHSMSNLMSF